MPISWGCRRSLFFVGNSKFWCAPAFFVWGSSYHSLLIFWYEIRLIYLYFFRWWQVTIFLNCITTFGNTASLNLFPTKVNTAFPSYQFPSRTSKSPSVRCQPKWYISRVPSLRTSLTRTNFASKLNVFPSTRVVVTRNIAWLDYSVNYILMIAYLYWSQSRTTWCQNIGSNFVEPPQSNNFSPLMRLFLYIFD